MHTPAQITLRIAIAAESSGFGFKLELVETGRPAIHAAGTLVQELHDLGMDDAEVIPTLMRIIRLGF